MNFEKDLLPNFFCKQHFYKQHQAEFDKKAKQHSETELLLCQNYSFSSPMLSSKTNMRYSKKCAKNKCEKQASYH